MTTSLEQQKKKLISFYKKHSRMPSYAELAYLLGYASKNAAHRVVQKMLDAEFIDKDERGKLLPGKLFNEIRLLGLVEAGFPSPAEEELVDTMSLDDFLVEKPEATFLLRVKGDSMKDAGIVEGDFVLVERAAGAAVGDIVVADVDGESTMKYLRKRGRNFYLQAANDAYSDIYPEGDMKIEAVVKGVVRKY
jgi:repressor LexA